MFKKTRQRFPDMTLLRLIPAVMSRFFSLKELIEFISQRNSNAHPYEPKGTQRQERVNKLRCLLSSFQRA